MDTQVGLQLQQTLQALRGVSYKSPAWIRSNVARLELLPDRSFFHNLLCGIRRTAFFAQLDVRFPMVCNRCSYTNGIVHSVLWQA